MFMIGDRYFGTMMVYVGEPWAEKYKFTSAMPTQLLKTLAPTLIPMLEGHICAPDKRAVVPLAKASNPVVPLARTVPTGDGAANPMDDAPLSTTGLTRTRLEAGSH
jgi:hypothetical protein